MGDTLPFLAVRGTTVPQDPSSQPCASDFRQCASHFLLLLPKLLPSSFLPVLLCAPHHELHLLVVVPRAPQARQRTPVPGHTRHAKLRPPPPEDGTSEPLPSNKSCSASPAATGTCPPEEDTVPLGKRPSSASTPSSSGAASPGGAEVAVSGASRPFILSLSRPSNAARTSPSLLPTRFSEVRVVLADNADDRADRAVEGGQGKGVDSPSTN